MKLLFNNYVCLCLLLLESTLCSADYTISPLKCMKATAVMTSNGYITTITIKNQCGKTVDLKNTSLKLNTNTPLKAGSFWGDFGGLSYPLNPVVSVNNNQITIGLNFSKGSLVNSKLIDGNKILVSFSSRPSVVFYNIEFYDKTPENNIPSTSGTKIIPNSLPNLKTSTKYSRVGSAFRYSFYKDTSINMNWNTYVISSAVLKKYASHPLLGNDKTPSLLLPGNNLVTLASATGTCGNEKWGGGAGKQLADANIPLFVKHNINYIISTGGSPGLFQCDSVEGMMKFINLYQSKNLVGIDFDVEGDAFSQEQLTDLINAAAGAQKQMKDTGAKQISFSLTLATLARSDTTLNQIGKWAVAAANKAHLNFFLNLITADYGDYGCQKNSENKCDMAESAIFASQKVSKMFNIPLNKIEVTPMIGRNDTHGEMLTLSDIIKIATFAKAHLAGLHYWSFDRDTPGKKTYSSPVSSSTDNPPLAYNKAILKVLGY